MPYWSDRVKESGWSFDWWRDGVIAVIVAAASSWLSHGQNTWENVWIPVLAALIAVTIWECGSFFIKFCFLAPRNQYNTHETKLQAYRSANAALESQNTELKAILDKKHADQAFADKLTIKYQEGLGVLNMPIGPDPSHHDSDTFEDYKMRDEEWQASVVTMLNEHRCSAQEVSYFVNIHEVAYQAFHSNLVVNHHKSMLSIRLHRLKKIIDIYAVIPIFTGN